MRSELETFPPCKRNFRNLKTARKDIEFDIDVVDGFIIKKIILYYGFCSSRYIFLHFYETYTRKLVNNFLPFLLSQIELKRQGVVIDQLNLSVMKSTTILTSKYTRPERLNTSDGKFMKDLVVRNMRCFFKAFMILQWF